MIPAHTTSVGLHTLYETVRYSRGPLYNYKPGDYSHGSRSTLTAISNRPVPVKGDGVSSYPYYRKVGRLWSLGDVDAKSSSRFYVADKSFGYDGIALALYPHGSSYKNTTVNLPDWMTNKVIQDAISEIQEIRANIMEDFGQTKQTVSMIWGIFRNIVELFILLYRRNWGALARRLKRKRPKDAAQAWLMFYYGIKPMVGTITALCDSQGPRHVTKSVRKRERNQVNVADFVNGASIQAEGLAEQRAQCGMTVRVDVNSTLAYWRSLGLNDPSGGASNLDVIVTVWALTPYSFVLDWILPVERFLRTRSWGSGIAYQRGYVSKVLYCLGDVTELNPVYGSGDTGKLPRCRVGCMQFQRIAYNNYTPPSGLALNLSLTSTQAFNAVALIVART